MDQMSLFNADESPLLTAWYGDEGKRYHLAGHDIMKGDLQLHWEHRIAKSSKVRQPRINLTFRLIREI